MFRWFSVRKQSLACLVIFILVAVGKAASLLKRSENVWSYLRNRILSVYTLTMFLHISPLTLIHSLTNFVMKEFSLIIFQHNLTLYNTYIQTLTFSARIIHKVKCTKISIEHYARYNDILNGIQVCLML